MGHDITVLEFDEKSDLDLSPAWFLDATHSVPPWTPMFAWSWINYCRHGMQWGAQRLQLPTCKGWDWRLKDGGGYLTLLVVEDEEEIRQREAVFRERLLPFIEDYDGLWRNFVDEMLDHYGQLKAFDLDNADNIDLLDHLEQAFRVNRRMWEVHFYMMYLVFGVYILFETICKELLDIDDTDPRFHKLMRGFDNKVFQVDKKLWEFAGEARDTGLADIFLNEKPQAWMTRLGDREAGRRWLARFRSFLEEDGWRANRMSEFCDPTWVEEPALAMVNVKQFLTKGGGFNLEKERETLVRERRQLEEETLARIPSEQREWFEALMKLAQKSSSFSEEHNHYLDLYTHALVRRALLGMGRRLARHGAVDEPEDILFLVPDEVRKAAICPEFFNLRPAVARRRAEWEGWCRKENPPFISTITMDEAVKIMMRSKDPVVLKVVVGSLPVPRTDLKADLYGISGSPGVTEGPARVVMSDQDLNDLREGEIMVAPSTYPSWTPVFSLLKGVVVDRGASLSHAAIVGREYGIPVVMNVFDGSKKIKTGQRIRVDGDLGLVFILDGGREN
ncbi:MAG: PEP-utilizing enzyme [Peptococcaceae bacterium]|nr:PEP-utilizing enzyme [Peptococcaceae bacterium]